MPWEEQASVELHEVVKLLLHRAGSSKLQFLDCGFQGTRAEIYGLTFLSLLADKEKKGRKRRMKGRGSGVEFRSSGVPQGLSATQKPKQEVFGGETGTICHQKLSAVHPRRHLLLTLGSSSPDWGPGVHFYTS